MFFNIMVTSLGEKNSKFKTSKFRLKDIVFYPVLVEGLSKCIRGDWTLLSINLGPDCTYRAASENQIQYIVVVICKILSHFSMPST